MSRRRAPDLQAAEKRVEKIMALGYSIQEFSAYHVRIWRADVPVVDYWPTSGRWRDPKGFKDERSGLGIETLKKYLRENYPVED